MTNAIIPFNGSNQPALPEYMRASDMDSQLAATAAPARVSLAGGIISIKQGQDVVATFGQAAEILIVGVMPHDGRVFYNTQFNPGADSNMPPACWSSNGVSPDADAHEPQSSMCATCPQNIKGSATNGQGKACAYIRNLAIAFVGDPNPGALYRLSAKGMTLFGKYDQAHNKFNLKSLPPWLQARGMSLATTILRMEVDPSVGVPGKLLFEPIGFAAQEYLAHFYDLEMSAQSGVLTYRPEVAQQVEQITALDFGRVWEALQNRAEQNTSVPAGAVPQGQPMQAQPVQQMPQQMAQPVQQAQAQPMQAQPVQQMPQQATQPVQQVPQQVAQPMQAQPVQQAQAQPADNAPWEAAQPVQQAQPASPAQAAPVEATAEQAAVEAQAPDAPTSPSAPVQPAPADQSPAPVDEPVNTEQAAQTSAGEAAAPVSAGGQQPADLNNIRTELGGLTSIA